MRVIVKRVLSFLMAFVLLSGQIQSIAAAMTTQSVSNEETLFDDALKKEPANKEHGEAVSDLPDDSLGERPFNAGTHPGSRHSSVLEGTSGTQNASVLEGAPGTQKASASMEPSGSKEVPSLEQSSPSGMEESLVRGESSNTEEALTKAGASRGSSDTEEAPAGENAARASSDAGGAAAEGAAAEVSSNKEAALAEAASADLPADTEAALAEAASADLPADTEAALAEAASTDLSRRSADLAGDDSAGRASLSNAAKETIPETYSPAEDALEEEDCVLETASISVEPAAADSTEEVLITLAGMLPEDAEVVASEAQAEAEKAGLTDVLFAYDITINSGWQPRAPLEVTFACDSLPEQIGIFHIHDDGQVEEVRNWQIHEGKVTFLAEGFSVYAVTEEVCRRTYEFWDYKLGEYLPYEFNMALPADPDNPNQGLITANRQILKNGDTLVIPSLPNRDGMRFLGWYTSPEADVNQFAPERGGVKNDITADTIVTLYARYGWPVTITWYAREEGTASNQVFSTQTLYLEEKGGSMVVDLSGQISPEPPRQGQRFVGWRAAGSQDIVDLTACTLSGDVSFYPCFSQMYEISFAREDDEEEFVSPVLVSPDGITGQLTSKIPSREGYIFNGWAIRNEETGQGSNPVPLTDAAACLLSGPASFPGGALTEGVLRLTKDISLISLWIPREVEYRVVFWAQKPADTKKLAFDGTAWSIPLEDREYDFLGTLRLTSLPGTRIPYPDLVARYDNLAGVTDFQMDEGPRDFTGLVFRDVNFGDGYVEDYFTVSGNGSNIVHVFYDREIVTLCFNYPGDVAGNTAIAAPAFSPALTGTGSVTQKAVTAVSSVDYPADIVITGLYGGQISDGKTPDGSAPAWPVSYSASNLSYTVTTRTMKYSNGQWALQSSSDSHVSEDVRLFSTHWSLEDGSTMTYPETFGGNLSLTPSHSLQNLSLDTSVSQVSYYKENEQAAYPASAVYSAKPALSYTALAGETVTVKNPFEGYELDFFTYTDSKGTPIRREAGASLTEDKCILTGGSFTNLNVYCRRKVYHIQFHNGKSQMTEGPGVKYGMSLATDLVKNSVTEPALPEALSALADEVTFAGWFMDEECTIYFDVNGMKTNARNRLMAQYPRIQMIVSVYDFKPAGGTVVPALRMADGDLHLFAGWIRKRLLIQLDPDGGELPEETPTFFWRNYGDTLNVFPVSRDYIPADQAPDQADKDETYVYHIHTYDESLKDKDLSDRTACYLLAQETDTGERYVKYQDSYRFLGWFLVEEGANGAEILTPYDFEAPLTGDVTLRAQWSRKGSYRIVYTPGDHGTLSGAAVSPTYRDHAAVALNGEVTAQEGYVFTGWKILLPKEGDGLDDILYSSGDELVIDAEKAKITWDEYTGEPLGVVTLAAQYAPVMGTSITYYVNGGTFVGATEEDLAEDPDLADDLKEKLTRDYGDAAAHRYIYDTDGTVIGYTISGIEQNASLTMEDGSWFHREGYKLMGWSSTPAGEVELPLNIDGVFAASDPDGTGFTFYAVWKPEKQVTYDLQGGVWNTSNGSKYREVEGSYIYGAGNGETAPVPLAPTKEGYAFAGWARSATAKVGLQVMPKVTGSLTLYAIWTTNVILRFDLKGGTWETLTNGFIFIDKNAYGVSVTAGKSYTLPAAVPVKEGGYLFDKWEEGSYQYGPEDVFKTTAEQAGQTLTLTALWAEGVPAVDVLIDTDDSIEVLPVETLVGAAEDLSKPASLQTFEGYQFLFMVYDELPEEKADILEHYRVTSIRKLADNTYQVTLANGETIIHYPDSAEKLQAIYIKDRPVDVFFKRINIYQDGMDNMNITLTTLREEPYMTLSVGKVDIQSTLPRPKDYMKNGSSNYTSFTYAIGKQDAEDMYAIDTMTQTKLWIRQTLNGFAFSVNGEEWKDLNREEGDGKNAAVYIIYDNRVETSTTINHTVYGLKSDKEKLFTYNIYVKGRWGFNVGNLTFFLNKPDDPSEELNSYTVAMHDGEKVLIPLHIDYLTGQNQVFKPGDLFYDMFGGDYPTTGTGRAELRIWQEVEMRRENDLPFENGTFATSIQMRAVSSIPHNTFNGFDSQEHLWLKQLGISKFNHTAFSHSFIYTRTSLEVPVHVLELTRDGYVSRDDVWMGGNENHTVSVTADPLVVDNTLAASLVNAPEGYSLQTVRYGLTEEALSGADKNLILRLAGERNNSTLLHVYDYLNEGDAADASTRTLVADGSEIYLIYYRLSQTDIPVEYVKKDASGTYTPVDLTGYNLSAPTVSVPNTRDVDFRQEEAVTAVNSQIRKLDAIYLTGRMIVANRQGKVLSVYEPGEYGDWDTGRALILKNSENGVIYYTADGSTLTENNVKVQIEVANNKPLRIVGRLWQRGSNKTSTGVFGYLPRDDEDNVIANGSARNMSLINKDFAAYQEKIPYAKNPDTVYVESSLANTDNGIYSVAYCTDEKGYRYWVYQSMQGSLLIPLSKILYADYEAYQSPVYVRYVVKDKQGKYHEVEDLEETVERQLIKSVTVMRSSAIRVSDAVAGALAAVDAGSALYRSTSQVAIGTADLATVVYEGESVGLSLGDRKEGLLYQRDGETGDGILIEGEFPDLYVVLQPVADLTITQRTKDETGYAVWTEPFEVTVSISLDGRGLEGTYQAILTSDDTVAHAVPVSSDQPGGGGGTLEFSGGKARVTLYHGQSLVISSLPRGGKVTVTEKHSKTYQVSYQYVEGAKVTAGNTLTLERPTRLDILNTSAEITETGLHMGDTAYLVLIFMALAGYFLCSRKMRRV